MRRRQRHGLGPAFRRQAQRVVDREGTVVVTNQVDRVSGRECVGDGQDIGGEHLQKVLPKTGTVRVDQGRGRIPPAKGRHRAQTCGSETVEQGVKNGRIVRKSVQAKHQRSIGQTARVRGKDASRGGDGDLFRAHRAWVRDEYHGYRGGSTLPSVGASGTEAASLEDIGTLKAVSTTDMADPTKDLAASAARRAFAAFSHAVQSGDAAPFADLLAEEVHFRVPLPFAEWQGEQRGRNRALELIAFERETMHVRLTLTLTALHVAEDDGGSAVVEFDSRGQVGPEGTPYENRLAIAFDFNPSGQVRAFREYASGIDPEAVRRVTGG